MRDENSSDFKIRLDDNDDETPDSFFETEIKDQRIEKLNQRITFFSILIPGLICVILFVAYLDIKKRVSIFHDTGTEEVQNLSQDLESRFSSLSQRHAKLKESLDKKILSIENATTSLKNDLKKTETTINKIGSSKTDKKELARAIAKIDKTLSPFQNDLKSISSEIESLSKNFKQELARLAGTIDKAKKDVFKLQGDISFLSSGKIGKKELKLALKNEDERKREKLSQVTRNLENKIELMNRKIKELERISKLSEIETVAPEPGKIIEQNIQ